MTLKMKVAVWLGLAALTILLLWIFRGILLPFLVGLLLAYLLDPVTDWLERYRFSRGWATTLSILGYVGHPFRILRDGAWRTAHGWQSLRRLKVEGIGARWVARCEVPDEQWRLRTALTSRSPCRPALVRLASQASSSSPARNLRGGRSAAPVRWRKPRRKPSTQPENRPFPAA